jgi:hypothetical protein
VQVQLHADQLHELTEPVEWIKVENLTVAQARKFLKSIDVVPAPVHVPAPKTTTGTSKAKADSKAKGATTVN